MLKKLVKYDMKSMNKMMLPAYILLPVLALITKAMVALSKDFVFLKQITSLIVVAFVLCTIGIFFYVFLASIIRFYKNLIKEEGYLTNTLPVRKSSLLWAKLLSSNIHFILTTLVAILSVLLVLNDYSWMGELWKLWSSAIEASGFSATGMTIYIISLLILSNVSNILLYYLAICLGQTRNDKKVLYSVAFGFIVYTVVQILGTVSMFLLGFIKPEIMNMSNHTAPGKDLMYLLFGYSTVFSLILIVGYFLLCKYLLDKKLNLE